MSAMTPLEYILEVVFALKPDSSLHCALESNVYFNPKNFLMEKEDVVDDLEYPVTNRRRSLLKGYASLLKKFSNLLLTKTFKL